MVGLCGRDDGSKSCEREVNTRERHQVSLEFVQIDVQGTVESERSCYGRDNLGNQAIEVCEARRSDSQILLGEIVDSFIVDHERTIGVFKGGVGC